jgi:hypothetical protein
VIQGGGRGSAVDGESDPSLPESASDDRQDRLGRIHGVWMILVGGGLVELRGSWAMSPPVLLFAQPGEDTSSRMRFPGRNTFDVARRSTRS